MKFTILKQVEQEVDIQFPLYYKCGRELFAKVLNEKEVIALSDDFINKSNMAMHYIEDTDYKECTESEFNNAYDTVLKNINDLKNK